VIELVFLGALEYLRSPLFHAAGSVPGRMPPPPGCAACANTPGSETRIKSSAVRPAMFSSVSFAWFPIFQ
jgi:hypothetical protein